MPNQNYEQSSQPFQPGVNLWVMLATFKKPEDLSEAKSMETQINIRPTPPRKAIKFL